MKNFRRISLMFCLIFTLTYSHSQVKYGPVVGLNISTMTLKSSGHSLEPKSYVGLRLGIISEIPLIGNLVLQPGILYSAKGSSYDIGETEASIDPDFIEVPVNALYKFDLNARKLFLEAGPYFAYGIGGKYKAGGQSIGIKFGSGQGFDMKRFDTGLNVGTGFEFQNVLISVHYSLGLANMAPIAANDNEMKVRTFGFSLAYLFSGK